MRRAGLNRNGSADLSRLRSLRWLQQAKATPTTFGKAGPGRVSGESKKVSCPSAAGVVDRRRSDLNERQVSFQETEGTLARAVHSLHFSLTVGRGRKFGSRAIFPFSFLLISRTLGSLQLKKVLLLTTI